MLSSFTMPAPIKLPSDSSDNLFDDLIVDMLELTDCASFANTSFMPETNGICISQIVWHLCVWCHVYVCVCVVCVCVCGAMCMCVCCVCMCVCCVCVVCVLCVCCVCVCVCGAHSI